MDYPNDLMALCIERLNLDANAEELLTALYESEYGAERITSDKLLEIEKKIGMTPDSQPAWIVNDNDVVHLASIVMDFIRGQVPILPIGAELVICNEEKSYGIEAQLAEMNRVLDRLDSEMAGAVINISGADGSGREFLFEQAAAARQMQVIAIDAVDFAGNNSDSAQSLARAVNAIAIASVLYGAIVRIKCGRQVIRDCDKGDYTGAGNPLMLIRKLTEIFEVLGLIICGPDESSRNKEQFPVEYVDFGRTLINIFIPDNGGAVRREIASFVMADEGLNGDALERLLHCASGVKLPHAAYIRYIRSLVWEYRTGKKVEELNGLRMNELANDSLKYMRADRKLDELKLPDKQKAELSKICSICLARDRVLKEGGFTDKFTYGNGLSVLFYGAPGTGKTMAAQVIAETLNKPLYRVELSQLINKYIGETQKNIGRIFDEAEKNDCVLLFDEADAIFAKRGDVADAQDRYSNAETAYLLQRMESYTGICVLTTNLLQNFDEAFRRRITYMINFPMPDASIRLMLWNEIYPAETRVGMSVDRQMLAETFELSGAAIRNIAQHSALLAAAEGAEEVQMSHIIDGIMNEYSKTGRNLSNTQKDIISSWT